MHRSVFSLVAVSILAIATVDSLAQGNPCTPGPITGNVIGFRTRISDGTNACRCTTAYALNHTLQLLDSYQPNLRLSANPSQSCPGEIHGDLAIVRVPNTFSAQESVNDFVLVAHETANNLLLATREDSARIIFCTTKEGAVNDEERMTILNIGHVGIATSDPRELLQIGGNLTFHIGSANDFVGYNVYVDGSGNLERINTGYSSIIDFGSGGSVRLGIGGAGVADAAVNFTDATGDFNGLILDFDTGGNGVYSFGSDEPNSTSRLLIRGHGSDKTTNALLLTNASDNKLMSMDNSGLLYIGSSAPIPSISGPGIQVEGDVYVGSRKNNKVSVAGFAHKMYVDGILFVQEAVVNTDSWSDHVFKEDFDLPTIPQLKAYIVEYGVLPNVPSESEVKSSGVKIGEFQAQLLEKVEMLTLYVIQLFEENQRLEAQLESMNHASDKD